MGVQINGSEGNVIATKGTFSGDVGIGGTLTYEDVTNIDSVGLITARSGIKVTSGDIAMDTAGNITLGDSGGSSDDRLVCGAGSDLQLFHDGTQSYLINATGNLDIRTGTDSIDLQSNNGGENMAKFVPNGAVELYYNNSKKFETTSAGVTVTGHLTVGTATLYSTGNLLLGDSDEIRFGDGEDLKIYHDGSHSYIKDSGTGDLTLIASKTVIGSSNNTEVCASFIENGKVELYYDNVAKFETSSAGAQVKNAGADTSLFITGSEGYSAQIQFLADDGDDYADYSRIYKDQDGGDLHFQNYASGSWEDNIVLNNNGSVELYHDNDKVFETIDYGINAGNNTSIYENSAHNIGIIRHADMHHAILFRAESNADGSSLTNTNTTTFREYGAFQFMTGAINMTTKFTIFQNGNATLSGTLTQGSDVRLKTDVVGITSALSKVNQIRGVEYKWNSVAEDNCGIRNREDGVKEIGVIADEIESIIPQVVKSDAMKSIDGTEYKSVAYDRLTPILIEAVKELSAEVDALKAEIAALKSN